MTENWLNINAFGYSVLSQNEKKMMNDFALLWSLFEAKVLNCKANASSIKNVIENWCELGRLDELEYKPILEYFVQRYTEDGELTDRFSHLHLRKPDDPSLIKSVLKGEETDPSAVVSAMLIIVLRYRNNFFHGIKWAYQFRGQEENFSNANNLLMKIIEINNQ